MAHSLAIPTPFNKAHNYEEVGELDVELTEVPRARTPSYTSKNSFWQGQDDDQKSLISHSQPPPAYGDRSIDDDPAVRTISQTPTAGSSREKRHRLQGWRFGVACSAWVAFTVLMLNVILTMYAGVKYRDTLNNGVGTTYTGSCDKVNSWAVWLHVLINALSSILLSASNYTMQCLSSPTRNEIDRAHARGDWMDIGVPSVRNLSKINWTRASLWWILASSSIPIHLLYNSAIFKTLDSNAYIAAVVTPAFLNGEAFNNNETADSWNNGASSQALPDYSAMQHVQQIFANNSNYLNTSLVQNMTNAECIANYSTSFVTGRNHVLVVTNDPGNSGLANQTVLWESQNYYSSFSSGSESYNWICLDLNGGGFYTYYSCDTSKALRNASSWTINNKKIEYCLSQVLPSHCKLQFSLQILITVIVMNACKSAVMFMTLWKQRDSTLVTVGDALASFLDRPDELTKGRCLMAKVDAHKGPLRWKLRNQKDTPNTQPLPVTYLAPLRRRWFAAASIKRWCITMGLCVAALITGSGLLGAAVTSLASYLPSGQSVFSIGFGAVDSRALLSSTGLPQGGTGGLVASVLLANLPQAIVSFLYLTYNGLFTSMLLSHEYSKYGMDNRKKPLRVTTPHGEQRSTYYLQLPYTYSAPLLIASAMLHWLISQSIFLARINVYSDGDPIPGGDTSQIGFSCLPILLVILLGTAMLSVALGMGFLRKFKSHIPVAGSCSVAIAAATHRPKYDVDAAFRPVQWGEVNSEGTAEVGHCCFTSEDVHPLIPGRMYAGTGPYKQATESTERGPLRRRNVR